MRKEMTNLSEDLRMLGLDGAVSKLTEDVTKTVPDYIKSWQEAGYKIALVETKGGAIVESAFVLGKYPQLLQERVAAGGGIIGTPYSFKLHNGKLGGKQLTEETQSGAVLLSCLVCGAKTKAVNESVVVPCSQCCQPINGQLAENVEYLEEGKELKPGSTDDIERLLKSLVGFDVEVYNGKDKALGELKDNSGESGYNHSDYEVAGNRPVRFNTDDVVKVSGSDIQVAKSVNFLDEAAVSTTGKKSFRIQDDIGKAKYTVSFHDGVKTHKDGSPFYDIEIFHNKEKRDQFVKKLKTGGYLEESKSSLSELNSQGEPVHEKKEPKAGFDEYHDSVSWTIGRAGHSSVLSQDEFETVVTAHGKGLSAKECAKEIINGRSGKTEAKEVANYSWKGGEQLWTAVRGKVESVLVMAPTPQHMDGFMVSFDEGGSKIVYGPDLFKTQEEAEEDLKYHSQAPAKKGKLSEDYEFSKVVLSVRLSDPLYKEWKKELDAFDAERAKRSKYISQKVKDLPDNLQMALEGSLKEALDFGETEVWIEHQGGDKANNQIDVRVAPKQAFGQEGVEETERMHRRALELSEARKRKFSEQTVAFDYKGKKFSFTFRPEEEDWWTAFKSQGLVFDVHYNEDYKTISVYEVVGKTRNDDTVFSKKISGLRKPMSEAAPGEGRSLAKAGLVKIEKGGFYGLEAKSGEQVAPTIYTWIDDEVNTNGMIQVRRKDGSKGAIEAFIAEAEEKQPKVDKLLTEKKRRQELVRRRWMEGCSESGDKTSIELYGVKYEKKEGFWWSVPAGNTDRVPVHRVTDPQQVNDLDKKAAASQFRADHGSMREGQERSDRDYAFKPGMRKPEPTAKPQNKTQGKDEQPPVDDKNKQAFLEARRGKLAEGKQKDGKFGVFVYKKGDDAAKDDEFMEGQSSYWDNKERAIQVGKQIAASLPAKTHYVEVWEKDAEGLWGNTGMPLWKSDAVNESIEKRKPFQGFTHSKLGGKWALRDPKEKKEAKDDIERMGIGFKSTVSAGEHEGKTGTVIKLIGEKPNFPGELLLVKFSDGTVGRVPFQSFLEKKKKGMAEADSNERLSQKYYELEYNGGDYKYSLGNLSDAGWFWDGTKGDNMMLLFLYRLVHSKVWTPELKKQLVDFKGLADFYKKARTNNSELGELAYSVAGDNVTFGFGSGYWDMFEDEIDYEKNVPTKKIETAVQDEVKAWLKKDLPRDLAGFLDWANEKDDIVEKVVEIWNDAVYSMAPMKSEERNESVKITGHLMTEESFRNRRSKRKMKTVRMVSGAKRIGECLELSEADAFAEKVKAYHADAERYFHNMKIVADQEEILSYVMDALEGEVGGELGAEDEKVVRNILFGADESIRAEIKKIGEAIGTISGANKSDKVTKSMVEDINNILAVMAKRVKSLAEADEMGDEEAEAELADMETLKSQVGEISDKLDGGTEVTVQDILPVISALIGVLENYIEVAQKILDAVGGEEALAPKEEPPQEEPGQSPETNTPETPSDLSQAVPPPGQESRQGRDNLQESHLMEGANTKTITDKKGNEILVSYQTPVAAKIDGKYYRTDKNWSATTSKHIGQYLPGQGPLAKRKAEVKPQEWFDQLLKIGEMQEAKQPTNAEVLKRVEKMFKSDFEFTWKKAMKVYTPVDDKSAAALKKAGFGFSFTAGQEDAVKNKIAKLYPGTVFTTVGGPEEYDEAKMTYEAWVKKLDKAGESVPLSKSEFESWLKVKGKVPTVKEALAWRGYKSKGGEMIPIDDPQGPDDISHLKHLPEIPLDEAKETSADKLAKKIKAEDTLELVDILEDGENTDSAMNEMIADNVKYIIERELGEKVLKTVIVDIEDKNLAGDNPNISTDMYFAIFTASFKDGSTYSGRVFADGIVNGDRFDLHSITVGGDDLRYFGP